MNDHNALNIYTDGSSRQSPRRGGIGVRFVFPDHADDFPAIRDFELAGYEGGPIGQMEINAVVQALKEVLKLSILNPITRVIVHTDSQYVVDGYPAAIYRWPKSGWMTSGGTPVANAEQWRELVKVAQKICRQFRVALDIAKTKGHAGNEHNDAADRMAKASAQRPVKRAVPSAVIRRRKGSGTTIAGSIIGVGQTLLVNVVSSEYLRVQRCFKLRCEVLSEGSRDRGKLDFFYSAQPLRAGHSYLITLKKTKGACWLNRVIREA